MKKFLIIIFLILAGASYGQPVIDSMLIDEMKGELKVYGKFASIVGKVSIDNEDMQMKSWTSSLIITSIPDSGKGAAGLVVVEALGKRSEGRMITLWEANAYSYSVDHYSFPIEDGYRVTLIARLDIHSLLKNHTSSIISFTPSKRTQFNKVHSDGGHYQTGEQYSQYVNSTVSVKDTSSTYQAGFNCKVIFDPNQRRLTAFLTKFKGITIHIIRGSHQNPDTTEEYPVSDNSYTFNLDSNFTLTEYGIAHFDTHGFHRDTTYQGGFTFFLPPLKNRPILKLPLSGTLFSFRDNVTLFWDSLSLMMKYHLQVSSDSLFSSNIIDTVISQTAFVPSNLIGLAKYYWRVAGVNSEGESRWSDVWNFWTGETANVKTKKKSSLSLSSYPNPSSNEVNISYSMPSTNTARILLYNFQGDVLRESAVTGSDNMIKWNISNLANGSYILGLITDKEQKTEIVKIVH